jgi:hypothetical protein
MSVISWARIGDLGSSIGSNAVPGVGKYAVQVPRYRYLIEPLDVRAIFSITDELWHIFLVTCKTIQRIHI